MKRKNRTMLIILAIIIQIVWFIVLIYQVGINYKMASLILNFLSIFVIVHIINSNTNSNIKLAWTIPIMTFPLFGGVLFLITGGIYTIKHYKKRINKIIDSHKINNINSKNIKEKFKEKDYYFYSNINYLTSNGFPIYNSNFKYFKSGEDFIDIYLKELNKAKKYIFIEYFIINEGYMWEKVLDILKKKVSEGVEVRVIYDGLMGSLVHKYRFDKYLKSLGIKSIAFNPLTPIFSIIKNNRDHRKITIIDGIVAFTGGINIADEYINKKKRFGYWKDNACMLKGDCCNTYINMFLNMWNVTLNEDEKYDKYMNNTSIKDNNSYIIPYGNDPFDDRYIARNTYLNLINSSNKYLYITTPYLVIDDEVINSLCLASRRGVDVRIITPGIPDKKIVYQVTRSFYLSLIRAGVKIYEYKPGFIHSKMFLSDDISFIVGSINLDYRSLYESFENALLVYDKKSAKDIKEDFNEMFEVSNNIKILKNKYGLIKNVYYAILRLFAPLM